MSGSTVAVKTQPLTVMMTDIAGDSERTRQLSRADAARWLTLHEDLLLPVFRAFGGSVVKTIGDAFLVTFRSPTDAVLCGTAIQDRLYLHNQSAPESDRMEVRIAISAGEVRVARGDIFGEPVNLAARVEGIAARGEVLITDAVYSTMNTAEVRLTPRGAHSFKGIKRAVLVYAAAPDDVAGAPPFGARSLARVRARATHGVDGAAVRAQARRAVAHARRFVVVAGAAWSAGISRFRSLPPRARAGASAALLAVLAAAVCVLVITHRGSRSDRSGDESAGHGDTDNSGDGTLHLASAGGDDVNSLFAALDAQEVGDAKRQLIDLPPGRPTQGLARLTRDGTWWQRHHALAILDARGEGDRVDTQAFAIADLESGSSCARRRMGLVLLRRVGKGDGALVAIDDAQKHMPDNACMLFDLGGAASAVRGRK